MMTHKILCLSLLTAACGFSSLRADVTLVEQTDAMGQNVDSTILVKDGHTRVDTPIGASVIVDLKSGEVISLMHAEKTYMKVPAQMAQAALAFASQSPLLPQAGSMALTATGKKDTISGYAADEYTFAVAGKPISVWLTKAAPDYVNLLKEVAAAFAQGPMGAIIKGIGLDIASLPGLPVRFAGEVQPGQTVTSTITSISSSPISDSQFAVPADYKEKPLALPGFQPAS
jgi:hypothetical protein